MWGRGKYFPRKAFGPLVKRNVFLEELKIHAQDIYTSCIEISKSKHFKIRNKTKIISFNITRSYEKCRSESIDYALMEKSDKICLVKFNSLWSDVGDWSSISKLVKSDSEKNTHETNHFLFDSKDTYINSKKPLNA